MSGELESEGCEAGCVLRPGPGEEEGGQVADCPPGVQVERVRLAGDHVRVETAELDQQYTRTKKAQLLQQWKMS